MFSRVDAIHYYNSYDKQAKMIEKIHIVIEKSYWTF